jgi:hypothetical protein
MSQNGGSLPRFEKDDIIIPRKNLKDKDWRASTIVVTEQLEDGTIKGYPGHGGFGLRIPPNKVREFDLIKVPQDMLVQAVFHKAKFDADWLPEGKTYVGWTTGELWNGWGVPYFEAPVAREVVADLRKDWKVKYDAKKDEFVLSETGTDSEDDPYIVPGDSIEVIDRGRKKKLKVYAIGAGSWTWNAPEYI